MGRRVDEKVVTALPDEIDEALTDLVDAFGEVIFPSRAMECLADLALLEYRLSERPIDRKHWHGQLVTVAKACAELDRGGVRAKKQVSTDDADDVVVHDD